MVRDLQEFFLYGMDRVVPPLAPEPEGKQINLGPGDRKMIPGTIGVGPADNLLTDYEWNFPERLPFDSESIAVVHAHHFLEHFTGEDGLRILRDIERVLMPSGVAYLTMPYPGTPNHFRALDHKSNWMEETWSWILDNPYYANTGDKPWQLRVRVCVIMGIVQRNLGMLTQLVKL